MSLGRQRDHSKGCIERHSASFKRFISICVYQRANDNEISVASNEVLIQVEEGLQKQVDKLQRFIFWSQAISRPEFDLYIPNLEDAKGLSLFCFKKMMFSQGYCNRMAY